MKDNDFRGIVGSFLYIAKQTRPDILATVSQLTRFLEILGRVHWVAAKTVFRNLKGSKDMGLFYTKDAGDKKLFGSTDADWVG